MVPISRITNPIADSINSAALKPTTQGNGDSFSNQLMDVLKEVNQAQNDAASKQTDLMTGRQNVDYHDLMISMEKASVAMQLTMSVRNKILDAYQEISKTQI